jgi:hypothetical protein
MLPPNVKYGIESTMYHKMLIFKARIDFVWSSLPPPENQFHDGIDSPMELILWSQCLGSLTFSPAAPYGHLLSNDSSPIQHTRRHWQRKEIRETRNRAVSEGTEDGRQGAEP